METAQASVSNGSLRNVLSTEPTTLQSRDVSSDRNDILPYLLVPDISLAIEVRGKTRYLLWFSDALQHRAYATVDQFLRSDDGRTIAATEVPSLRLGTMPRSLHISPNNILLGMRTWLNGWIHFYATNGDEDRANGLRHFSRSFNEVPPNQSAPTSSSVPDDNSSDGDHVMDEAVIVDRSSFQDETSADAGLRRDLGPRMDSTNKALPNVSLESNLRHPHDAPNQRAPAEEVCSTKNATPSPADAPTDRQEYEPGDKSGITWNQMREKHRTKRANEDSARDESAHVDRPDDNPQASTRHEVNSTQVDVTAIEESRSVELGMWCGIFFSEIFDDELGVYRSPEEAQFEPKAVTDEVGDILHQAQASQKKNDQSNGDENPERSTEEALTNSSAVHLVDRSAAEEDNHLDILPTTGSKADSPDAFVDRPNASDTRAKESLLISLKVSPRGNDLTRASQPNLSSAQTDTTLSAAASPLGQTSELPVFFIDPFEHTHRISLSSCTYWNFSCIVLSKCNEVLAPNHIRERVVRRQFSILTTDGIALTLQNAAQLVLPGRVLEVYWQQKQKHSNMQDQFHFDNLPTRHPVHAGEIPIDATSQPGLQTEVTQSSNPASRDQEATGLSPIIPRDVDHNHDEVAANRGEKEDDSTILKNRKRQSDTVLEEAGSKRRKVPKGIDPCTSSNDMTVELQDLEDSRKTVTSKPVSTLPRPQKQASNSDGKDIQLQIQGGLRAKSQQQLKPQKAEVKSLVVKLKYNQLANQAEQLKHPSRGASGTSVSDITHLDNSQKTKKDGKKVHTGYTQTFDVQEEQSGEETEDEPSLQHLNRVPTAKGTLAIPASKQTQWLTNQIRAPANWKGPFRGVFPPGPFPYPFGSVHSTYLTATNTEQSHPVAPRVLPASRVRSKSSEKKQRKTQGETGGRT